MTSWAEVAAPPVVPDPDAVEERFLETLRRRVSWQADTASRLRGGVETAAPEPPLDLLDVSVVALLVESRPGDPRAAEWQDFVADLRVLAGDDGRLHEDYECLVRAVLGDLLP